MSMLSLFLMIGTVLMCFPIMIMSKQYKVAAWKSITIAVLLTMIGTIGTYIMFFVENGNFKGTSFFGAVFFVPIIFTVIAPLFKIPYGIIMDMCAAGECIMLALMKVKCLIADCCTGKIWFYSMEGIPSYYPVREAELINALLILGILMYWHRKGRHLGMLYAWYMLIYGVTRFILNSFRTDLSPFVWMLAPGHFWSLCSCVLGTAILLIEHRKGAQNIRRME